MKLLRATRPNLPTPLVGCICFAGLTVFAEVLCAALIVVGLFTRWAVIPLIVTMLVAIFIIHIGDPFEKMEMAIIYLTAYAAIGWAGPGRFSLDEMMRK